MAKSIPEDKTILTVYGGEKLMLNGKSFKDYPHKGGGLLSGYQTKLTLEPGEYEIVGDYSITSNSGRKNNKFKGVRLVANLRGGFEYDLGVLVDSRELEIAIAYTELNNDGWFLGCRILED